jgi:hypothetical protein
MTGEAKALELFDHATKAVHGTGIITKEEIEVYGHMAMQAVDIALKQNDFRSAIDAMEKTKAIEDYVISQIARKRVTVANANRMVVVVFKIIRDIGWWLDENLEDSGRTKKYSDYRSEIAVLDKPKFYLEELEISAISSHRWQKIARMPEEEFEAYIAPFLKVDKDDRDALLSVTKLLSHLSLKKEGSKEKGVEVVEKPDIKMTHFGRDIYDEIHKLETNLLYWLVTISDKDKMTVRELLFLGKIMDEHRRFMGGVMKDIMNELESRGYKKKAA